MTCSELVAKADGATVVTGKDSGDSSVLTFYLVEYDDWSAAWYSV